MTKPRVGRPKSNEPIKDKRVSLKVTTEDKELLEDIAVKYSIVYSDILEKGIEYWKHAKTVNYNVKYEKLPIPKDKRVSMKVTFEKWQEVKELSERLNISYYTILTKGMEFFSK